MNIVVPVLLSNEMYALLQSVLSNVDVIAKIDDNQKSIVQN